MQAIVRALRDAGVNAVAKKSSDPDVMDNSITVNEKIGVQVSIGGRPIAVWQWIDSDTMEDWPVSTPKQVVTRVLQLLKAG